MCSIYNYGVLNIFKNFIDFLVNNSGFYHIINFCVPDAQISPKGMGKVI